MIKLVSLLTRAEDLSHEEFVERWDDHAELGKDLPGLRKYTRSTPVDPEACAFDGIAEVYFESVEDCLEALDSEVGRAAMRDAAAFTDQESSDDEVADRQAALRSMLFETHVEYDATEAE